MDTETAYLCILAFNLGFWMLLTRAFPVMRWIEMTFVIDRQLIKDVNDTGLRFFSKQLDGALSKDDKSLNGFNPPRTLRFVVGLLLVVENVVVMLVPWKRDRVSLASVSSQAGRLCFLNMLPLCLLVIPENSIMPRLVRQCREQWLWGHAFFGYLVVFQAAFHVISLLCLLSTLSNVRWSAWATGLASGILLVLVVVFSAWRQQLQTAISRVIRNPALAKKPTESSHSIMVHWMLGTLLAGVMMAHTISDLPWALMSVIASSVALLVGMSIIKKDSTVPNYVVKTTYGQEGKPGEPHVHVLEVDMKTSSGTTAGEWYYFKVDGIPIRVARLERRARRDGAGYDVVAVLLMSRDAQATGHSDVRGPYIIPLAAPIATNRPLRIITLDSGVVEAQQYMAWRGDLKRVEGAYTSLVWLNENPLFLKTWISNAGPNETSHIRIVCFGDSEWIIDDLKAKAQRTRTEQKLVDGAELNLISRSHRGSVQDVLREEMLLTDDTYFIGEHFRSYNMSLIRFDEVKEAEENIVDGQTDDLTGVPH